jgi:hypothetical protein
VGLRALLPALVRHLGTYLELGAAVAAEYQGAWVRRALLCLIAALALFAGAGIFWLGGLMALWDSTWRVPYVLSTGVLLLVAGATAGIAASKRPSGGTVGGILKSELRKDAELFQQWKDTISN